MTDLSSAYEAVARNLREFGYPDVTATMVCEIHKALLADKDLPHGVIGMFAKSQFEDNAKVFGLPEG